jgi:hypothetical protein
MEPFPPKPKGMQWHTYSQLYLKARSAEEAGMNSMLVQFERMSAGINPGDPSIGVDKGGAVSNGRHKIPQNVTSADV